MQVAAPIVDNASLEFDLGPLAWVLDELRKSLDGATQALRRFVRDAELSRGLDMAALDASHLRIARQQLHQAVGALEMVGLEVPARMLRAMEVLVNKFVERPEFCSDEAALKVERASFALTDYLEALLKGRKYSSIGLFPQYRDLAILNGDDRIHPADLWSYEWHWLDVAVSKQMHPLAYDSAVRSRFDGFILNVVKAAHVPSALALRDISLAFAANQTTLEARVFWAIAAAYFEAVAFGLCAADVHAKRAASQLLLHYRGLVRGEASISDRLAKDLLFFCSQAVLPPGQDSAALRPVQQAYGFSAPVRINYEKPQFGRFDPAVLVQARKRVAAAAETWSVLSGGDTGRIKTAADQFGQVADSIVKLHPENEAFSAALRRAIDSVTRSGAAPTASLAMEVATAVLYLEAAYEDMDPDTDQTVERGARLAQRLDHVLAGGQPEPLDVWMEELYRRVSDRQVMGSVVDELRTALGEVETTLDTFFRHPDDTMPLHQVPGHLAQMRGVFSVLGLDQAALAVLRMRDSIERVLVDGPGKSADHATVFEKLGNSLGTLGFLIDMLSYQRELAKKLFIYDDGLGEFRSMMGRQKAVAEVPLAEPAANAELAAAEVAVAQPMAETKQAQVIIKTAQTVVTPVIPPGPFMTAPVAVELLAPSVASVVLPPETQPDDDDAELREIFMDEAREVISTGLEAISALRSNPADFEQQTTLRRAFHTLKGSSRMVGFNEFGEAAWALEQLLNAWLPQQLPASPELTGLSADALQGFAQWLDAIAARTDAAWESQPFRQAADSLRLAGERIPLGLAVGALSIKPEVLEPSVDGIADAIETAPPLPDLGLSDDELVSSITDVKEPQAPESELPLAPQAEEDALEHADFVATQMNDFGETQMVDFSETLMSDFGDFAPTPNVTPDVLAPAVVVTDQPTEPVDDFELKDLAKFDVLADLGLPPEMPTASVAALESAESLESFELPAVVSGQSDVITADEFIQDQVKVIGGLRMSIALYNVYLNEADEWSRRLLTELTEWSLELTQPVLDSTVGLAHSLAGSSATVGFLSLSELARGLEHALEHIQLGSVGQPEHARLFVEVAEDMRRLLHQFAAGFLKQPDPALLPALHAVLETDLSQQADSVAVLSMPAAESIPDQADVLAMPVSDVRRLPAAGTATESIAPESAIAEDVLAPVVEPLAVEIVPEDTIEATDHLDVDLFPIFEEEALELLPKLGAALRQWSESPGNLGARQEALRVLHTLKGSARLAGAMRLGEMAHLLESAAQSIDATTAQSAEMEPLLGRLDRISVCFEELRATPIAALVLPEAVPPTQPTPEPMSDAAPMVQQQQPLDHSHKLSLWMASAPVPATLQAVRRPVAGQNIRVKSQLIDRMVDQAGEVMMSRSRLESRLSQLRGSLTELTANLARLRSQLRDIEVQSESQMQSRLAQTKDVDKGFDPLEFDRFTRVQELTRMMAESVHDVATLQSNLQQTVVGVEDDLIMQARQTRELQRDLLRTRMIEFDSISERLHGVVRQAAKDFDKPVKLDILGAGLEIDRGVLDRVVTAFEHLLRNAVGHGIETAVIRQAAGKPLQGLISITLEQQSNDVAVTFRDDGGGLNLSRIREKALSNGQITADQVLTDEEIANLIFTSGLSTAAEVSEMAGRGIGMDIVRSEVNALGGRIELSTQQGLGTQFKLVLPLTTAVNQIVLLRIGERVLGVPASLVDMVRRTPVAELDAAYLSGHLNYNQHNLDFFWGGALLQMSQASQEPRAKTAPVVIFRSAGQRVAVHVDEVLGNQEVVVKNLGPQLAQLPGLAGMSILASGAVVLIYNPVALVVTYGTQARTFAAAALTGGQGSNSQQTDVDSSAAARQAPLILVVDDSITVRRVTQRLLKREGYRVALAADGLLALELLQGEKPAVVLSDIEMPRMDGFDLVRNIRADANLQDLPVIMITSRIAEKHREYARELKVDHYLGKPYPEDELLALVHDYCRVPLEASEVIGN